MPVTPWRATRGMPMAPKATGAVLARSASPAACKRTEAEADEDGGADGDGRAEAGGALKECAEREGDEEELQAAVGGDAGQALLQE